MKELFAPLIIAATFGVAGARTVTGTVVYEKDSVPARGASCILYNNNQKLVGTSADSLGRFTLSTDLTAALDLKISMVGCEESEVLLNTSSGKVNVGTIYLIESGETLDQVTVTDNGITESRGRTIIYPSAADLKASSTSLALFMKLPLAGLEANPINRTIAIDGGQPMILINGVPSTMDDVNALKPGDIKKIEYSRVTPARYADKAVTGLVSITLKQRTDGGQVYLWGRSAVATAFVDGNLRASYHQGPSQFTLSYNPSWRNYQKVYDNTIESYIGDDFLVDLDIHDRNPFNYHYHTIRFKYDYSPDTKTLFSATFRATPSYNSSRAIITASDSELGDYEALNKSSSSDFAPSIDIFFRRDFNDKNSLEAQVVGTLSSTDYRRENSYDYAAGEKMDYVMDADSRRRSLISEITFNHSFSDASSLSGGIQNTLSHSRNNYLDSDYKPVLTENNNYIYAKFGQEINKVYLSIASGMKLFWIENDHNKRHFARNLTIVQASWNPGKAWSLTGAFSYTPSIPSLTALTDYTQQVTPYLATNGNPDLKVSESFIWQLMPAYKYKKFNTSLLLTYRTVKNNVISDVTYLGDRLFLSQSINARHRNQFSGNLNLRLSDVGGFGGNVNLSFSHEEVQLVNWSHNLTTFSGSFTLWWNKGPYTISYWRKIPGKYLSGTSVWRDENGDALGFDWRPDKHWSIGLNWMYMFEKKGTRYPRWDYSPVNPSVRERYIKNNANMIVLSVSYSADFGSIFRTGRRSLNNADNGSSLLKL